MCTRPFCVLIGRVGNFLYSAHNSPDVKCRGDEEGRGGALAHVAQESTNVDTPLASVSVKLHEH